MRCVTYRCEYCDKLLSDKDTSVPHVHIKGNIKIQRQVNSGSRWVGELVNKCHEETHAHVDCLAKHLRDVMNKLKKGHEFYSTEKV